MKFFAVLSVFTTVAVAQSSSSSAAAPAATSNSIIPSGISSSCSTYLTSLNTNTSLSSCVASLISATASFGPTSNVSSASSATISTALTSVCSSNSGCPDTLIREKITDFYSACSPELTSNPVSDVIRIYDVLYVFTPFKNAVCSKDDSGNFCVTENATSKPLINQAKDYLYLPTATGQSALIPNTTTYENTNLVFLSYIASMKSADLCTSCARNVMNAYVNFAATVPYAPGLTNSLLLSGQTALYKGMVSECGSEFFGSALQAAGGLSGSLLSGSAPRSADLSGLITLAIGVLALAFSLVL